MALAAGTAGAHAEDSATGGQPMGWKQTMPMAIIAFYFFAIALEFAASRLALVKARYQARDTLAAFGMSVGNFVTNLLMAGIVFAGLSAGPVRHADTKVKSVLF